MATDSRTIELQAILIPDKKLGGFTAYFERFPEVIAEGDSEDEALQNLKDAFFFMLRDLVKSAQPTVKDYGDDTEFLSRTVKVFA